jgi:flagellar hook assembly protein FlgD
VDEAPPEDCDVYMVPAVRLETTGSGTSLNLSAGAIDSLERTASVDPVSRACILGSAPNPFTAATEIRYRLSGRGNVSIRVFDARGRLVRRLAAGAKDPGTHTLPWDGLDDEGRAVPSGTYYLSLDSCEGRPSRKIIVVR